LRVLEITVLERKISLGRLASHPGTLLVLAQLAELV
jgi:hypothetical protein